MRRPGILVALILAVGIVGTLVALKSRESNAAFVLQQQALAPVAPAALDQLLVTSNDSRPGYSGHARAARCRTASHSTLGNPWSCLVRYRRPPDVRFHVSIHSDRSISGFGQPTEGPLLNPALSVHGCCVVTP